jgi:hypothetical protein
MGAVPDIAGDQAGGGEVDHRDRGAHAPSFDIVAAGHENGTIAPVDTGNQLLGDIGNRIVRIDDAADVTLLRSRLHVFMQDFDHHAAGDFAGLVSPHAVGYGVQVQGVIDQHAVFIVDLAFPDIGDPGCLDESHRISSPGRPLLGMHTLSLEGYCEVSA